MQTLDMHSLLFRTEKCEMLKVNELYYLQYLMLFPAEWQSPMSDYYMKAADSESGKEFVLTNDEKPVAYAVLIRENPGWILKYILTIIIIGRIRL